MLCKKCGAQLNETVAKCPECGYDNALSGGSGFWDIVDTEGRNIPAAQASAGSIGGSGNRFTGILLKAAAVICALSLLAGLYCLGRASLMADIVDRRLEQAEQQEQKLEKIRIQLEAKHPGITSDITNTGAKDANTPPAGNPPSDKNSTVSGSNAAAGNNNTDSGNDKDGSKDVNSFWYWFFGLEDWPEQ